MLVQLQSGTTWNIEPPLQQYAAGFDYTGVSGIDTSKPKCNFILVDDNQINWSSLGKVPLSSLSFEGVEIYT
jgi:hypothetical protein